jgi:hypothetical protein
VPNVAPNVAPAKTLLPWYADSETFNGRYGVYECFSDRLVQTVGDKDEAADLVRKHNADLDATERRYILHDHSLNEDPQRNADGAIVSEGALGRLGIGNGYLTTYGSYPAESRRPGDLGVGEAIHGVTYNLSGGRGVYSIYRVM